MNRDFSGGRWTRSEFVTRSARAGIALVAGALAAEELANIAGSGVGEAATGTVAVHHYHSRPDLEPAVLTATRRAAGPLAPGLLFLTPSNPKGQQGVLIADNDGEPIWFQPTMPVSATNLRAALYKRQPVLTWWEGTDPGGLGRGTHAIADAHYRVIARLPAGNGRPSDLHEFMLTPHGTALVTSWETVQQDLRRFQGPANGIVVGGVVQEIEIPSGKTLFEWHSLEHVSLDESYSNYQQQYNYFDYFHANSIAPTGDGNLLVSARNTWGIYKIDRGSGQIMWRLGGRKSDFQMGPGAGFAWQHDARPHEGGRISVFDDGASPKVHNQSRGLVLHLDTTHMRATVKRQYLHSPTILAWALGSTQLLPNGNVLVGYGTEPYLTEFRIDGTPLLDLSLPAQWQNYRALRYPWVGQPLDQPQVARASNQLFASWNGATEVAFWQLEAGTKAGTLTAGAVQPRGGFETALPLPANARHAAAVALDAEKRPIGRSATVRL